MHDSNSTRYLCTQTDFSFTLHSYSIQFLSTPKNKQRSLPFALLFKDCNSTEIVQDSEVPQKKKFCHHERHTCAVRPSYLLSLQTRDL